MPNVSWQEPQILVDLLALNLYADRNGMELPGPREIIVCSPWLTDIEMSLSPGSWHQQLTMGERESRVTFLECMRAFLGQGWTVRIAVLAYGPMKSFDAFHRERRLLRQLLQAGAEVSLVSMLHAKGVVTPLGLVTGSTNVTMGGLYQQAQNARYLAHDQPEYAADRAVLLGRFEGYRPATLEDLGS
jgi:hypothetical protein